MNKNIKIISVEVKKTGTNERTGKDWTLYVVRCDGDPDMTEFSTFNPEFVNSENQQMRVNVAYNEKFKNWQEVSEKQEAEQGKHEEILSAIRQIWKKIDDLENLIRTINEKTNIPEEHLKEGELEMPIYDEEQ